MILVTPMYEHGRCAEQCFFQYVTLTSSSDVTPTSSTYQQRKFPLTDTLLRYVLLVIWQRHRVMTQ